MTLPLRTLALAVIVGLSLWSIIGLGIYLAVA